MLSSSKIVMLCDDICLQFERGFSCEEIVQRCQSMLGTKDLGSICAEIQGGEQLATKFANDVSLELCGLRMYKVLRMMKTPVREVMLSIDKLRLFAVRCMHLGLESSYWKLNKTREEELIQHDKSKIEVFRCYVRTSLKFRELDEASLELKCLQYAGCLIHIAEAMEVIKSEYGPLRSADAYAANVFSGFFRLTELELEALKMDSSSSTVEAIKECTIPRWDGAMCILLHATPHFQFRIVELTRKFGLALLNLERPELQPALFFLNFASTIQSSLRTKNKMSKLVDRQAELDDLLVIADVHLKLKNNAKAVASITHLEQLAQDLGPSLCQFALFKCRVLRFLCNLQTQGDCRSMDIENDTHQKSPREGDAFAQDQQIALMSLGEFAENSFLGPDQSPEACEAATLLLASCCHAYCSEFGYSSETLQASFFALERSFLSQPLVMTESWIKLLFKVNENENAKASWGIILKGLLSAKSSILGEDLKTLVSCLWNKVCKLFCVGQLDDAKVVAEYLYEFVIGGNVFLQSKALLALSFLIASTAVAATNTNDLQRALSMVNKVIAANDTNKNLARMIKLRLLIRMGSPYIDLVNEMIEHKVAVDECILQALHELCSLGMLESAVDLLDKLITTYSVSSAISVQLVKERMKLLFIANKLSPLELAFQGTGSYRSSDMPSVDVCKELLGILDNLKVSQKSLQVPKEKAAMDWVEACGWNLGLLLHHHHKNTKLACQILFKVGSLSVTRETQQKYFDLALSCSVETVVERIIACGMTSSDGTLASESSDLLPLMDNVLTSAERVGGSPASEMVLFSRLLLYILHDKSRSVDFQPLLASLHSKNGTLCFCLGIIAKARGEDKVSKMLLKRSLQVEYSNGNLTQCAYVAVELIGLARTQEETLEEIKAALDLIHHENNSCEVDIEVQIYIADLLWNIGVDSALGGERVQAKKHLLHAISIFNGCAVNDLATKRKHQKLTQAYNAWEHSLASISDQPNTVKASSATA